MDIVQAFNLHDCGDVNVGSGYQTVQRGKKTILEILHGGALPVIVGGEHLVTVSRTKAVNELIQMANMVLLCSMLILTLQQMLVEKMEPLLSCYSDIRTELF